MHGYSNSSNQAPPLAGLGRKVDFRGETPNEEYIGFIEVMDGQGDTISVHVERSALKKYSPRSKWHTESVYANIDAKDWRYLLGVIQEA